MKKIFMMLLALFVILNAVAETPLLNAEKTRITDQNIQADLSTLKAFQSRMIQLNNKGISLAEYFFAKAQAWIDFAWDEYSENDRGIIIQESLRRADVIIRNYETGKENSDMTTPIIKESSYIRPDLWLFVEKIKKDRRFKCVQDLVAKLEIQLICAGHEEKEMGWRHAKTAILAAERMVNEINKKLNTCKDYDDNTVISVQPPIKNEPDVTPVIIEPKLSFTIPPDIITEATSELTALQIGKPLINNSNLQDVIITNDSPDLFKIGITNVKWVAKSKNIELSAIQKIQVRDTTPPQIFIPDDIKTEAKSIRTKVFVGKATAIDIVDKNPIITSDSPEDFPVGITEIMWTAADVFGNKASLKQKITVIDTTSPVLRVPADINVLTNEKNTHVEIGMASATDNSDLKPIITNDAPLSFPIGTTIINWFVTDQAGNKSVGQQKVNVVNNSVPSIIAPPDITHEMTDREGTMVNIGIAVGHDNIDSSPIITNDAPKLFKMGTTDVKWVIKNSAGNTATAIQKVTLVDTTPPSLILEENIKLYYPVKDLIFNNVIAVDIVDPKPVITNDAPKNLPEGKSIITWVAKDIYGNSVTKVQNVDVVVIEKSEKPVVIEDESLVINVPGNIHFALDKYNISPKTAVILMHVVSAMKKYPELGITLTGYTDPRGSIDHNMKLSEKRVKSVASFLISKGIENKRITTFSTIGVKSSSDVVTPYNMALQRTVLMKYYINKNQKIRINVMHQEEDIQIERKK